MTTQITPMDTKSINSMENKPMMLLADVRPVAETQKREDTGVFDGSQGETWSTEPVQTFDVKVDDELVAVHDPRNPRALYDVRHTNDTPDVAHDTSHLHNHQSMETDLSEGTRLDTRPAVCGKLTIC